MFSIGGDPLEAAATAINVPSIQPTATASSLSSSSVLSRLSAMEVTSSSTVTTARETDDDDDDGDGDLKQPRIVKEGWLQKRGMHL